MKNAALCITDAAIGYRNGKNIKTVAEGINASLHCGELVALIGRNGAGKSTLLRTLSAFQKPLSGRIELSGMDIAGLSPSEVAKRVAVVLTSTEPAPLTVGELVSLGRTPYTNFLGRMSVKDKELVREAMELMGVHCFGERNVADLSDGERQKCMIAKALAQETSVILLDEPTAFLDFGSKVNLFRMLKRLAVERQKAILVSTHDIEMAVMFAHKLWLMHDGALDAGSVDKLSDNGSLHRFISGDGVAYDKKNNRIEITEI